MTPKKRLLFFEKLDAAFPNPKTELHYTNTFTLLVAVVLSARMTDAGVNKATKGLFEKVQTPEGLLDLGEEVLRQHIKTIGLYPTKARHLMALASLLIERHQGQVPSCSKALEALPGVGRKTANVVLNVAFDRPTMPVDTHVFRVANRAGLAPGKNVLEVEKKLLKAVPGPYAVKAHHLLILHGRYVCKARGPLCEKCPVSDLCAFYQKENPGVGAARKISS